MDPKQFRDILKDELEPIKQTQVEHTKLLEKHSELLQEHTAKIDAITVELHHVHQ